MQERCTTKMRKCISMKFWCIISGCPAGARKWHISYFCYAFCIAKSGRKHAASSLKFYVFVFCILRDFHWAYIRNTVDPSRIPTAMIPAMAAVLMPL